MKGPIFKVMKDGEQVGVMYVENTDGNFYTRIQYALRMKASEDAFNFIVRNGFGGSLTVELER